MTTLRQYKPQAQTVEPMSAFLVTVKVKQEAHHDPQNKVTGICPVSMKLCTDTTGAHHSMLVVGSTAEAVKQQVAQLGYQHITRIEEV